MRILGIQRKLKISVTLLSLILVFTLVGGVSAQDQVNLRMTVWDLATTPYWQAVADAYQEANPGVTIELIDIASAEYQDVVNVMLSGGDDVDIITVKDIPGYSAMLTRGQIIPLNDYIEAAEIDLSLYSGAAEELTYEDALYALPFRSDIWILYYNKAIFDAAGLPYPTNDMTWEEFDAIARQLASGEGADRVYGAHFHTWRSTVQLPTVQDGENIVIAEDYSFMAPIYNMITSLQADRIIMDFGELKAGNIHYSGVFKNGQVAMLPMGSWFIGSLIAAENAGEFDFDWGIARYPHPEGGGRHDCRYADLAGHNTLSENKDAAFDFIKFYSGVEGAQILAELGNLPAIRTPEVLATFAAVEGVPAEAEEALQTAAVRLELPMQPNVGAYEQILNQEHELIMTNSVSVEDGIAEINRRVAEEIEE